MRGLLRSLAPLFLLSSGMVLWAQAADEDLRPFAVDWSEAADSAIDLSRFLKPPAGQGGPLRVQGARLVRPDGSRFRAWGVNASYDICFVPRALAPKVADDFARFGFNTVRFHHLDVPWGANIFDPRRDDTQELNPDTLDRLDFLIAELKKRGIGFVFTLNVHREFKPGDGVADREKLGIGKPAYHFDPRVQELYFRFARQLLTHKNPYTGLEYRHEPALAWVELLNENSLIEAWAQWRLMVRDKAGLPHTWSAIPPAQGERLTRLWNDWLQKNATPEQRQSWSRALGGKQGGPVPRSQPHDWPKNVTPEHYRAELRFLMDLERDFFTRTRRLLRDELGLACPIIGDGDHNDTLSPYPHLLAFNLQGDFLDGHGYWEHPEMGPPLKIKNTPMVNDPLDSTVVQFARTPVAGRPYTISETNHPFPHRYACEGFPILTAYSLFQDWDGLLWFDWGPGRVRASHDPSQVFGFSSDPTKLAAVAACGLMFHRGDVQAAKETVTRPVSREQALDSLRWDRDTSRPFYSPGFPRDLPLRHAVRWQIADAAPSYPPAALLDALVSVTGELAWRHADRKKGLVTVDTPRSQALVGFVRHDPRPLTNLRPAVDNDFCALVLTSLDDRPIATSGRLLLTATGRVENTGMAWQPDGRTIASWGQLPTVIEPITGTVTLTGLSGAREVTVQPLTALGKPQGASVPARRSASGWEAPLGKGPTTTWYILDVRR